MNKFQRAYAGYIAHPDPLMEAGNLLAFVIGTNQPFYPVYLLFIVGTGAWRALPLLASMPFFLAVPLLARRFPIGARLLLVLPRPDWRWCSFPVARSRRCWSAAASGR